MCQTTQSELILLLTTLHSSRHLYVQHIMSSLLALLSQQSPNLQTRKALILTGLQNDFLSPEGKLPVSTTSGFLDRLKELVPAFREHGDVIWVRSQFEANREVAPATQAGDNVIAGFVADDICEQEDEDERHSPVPCKKVRRSTEERDREPTAEDLIERIEIGHPGLTEVEDEDPELFLAQTVKKEPCCIPGSTGAEYATQIKDLIDEKDMHINKTYYSAFRATSLLINLRSKIITKLFICGCITNLSVFATAMDAARYGIQITLVEDCLGYRRKDRHDFAIKQLRELVGLDVLTSENVIERLRNPLSSEDEDELDDNEDDEIQGGEEADDGPADLFEADDEDDDESELTMSIVRSSRLPHRALQRRHASRATSSLPQDTEIPAAEHTEPSGSRDADCTPFDSEQPSHGPSERLGRGKRKSPTDARATRATSGGDDSVTEDESPKRVTEKPKSLWGYPRPAPRSTHPGLAAMSTLVGLDQQTVDEYEGMMKKAQMTTHWSPVERIPLFGEDNVQGSAGSCILYDLLPPEVAETVFAELREEITWQHMYHQTGEVPRLVCCEGTVGEDGSMPVYRHPSDQTLPIQSWTPVVDRVRKAAEEVVDHPLNHALIQLYRSGADYISEHSDKTLDIKKGSSVVNVSFGAQRIMRLRTKRAAATESEGIPTPRTTHRIPMPHNSMLHMSLATNAKYLHGINADKRPAVELSEAEKAFDGQRISLTFRHIDTFLNIDSSRIWGQGATGKTQEEAKAVVNGDIVESERLVTAFGAENQATGIDWEAWYRDGFDILHLK